MRLKKVQRSPNIILCLVDQLRAFELGCYGNPVIRTPNVDRLAAEGLCFETALTNFPVCMAARSVLLSGQYNRWCTGGVTNVSYPGKPGDFNMPEYPVRGRPHLKDPTLAEALRVLGYSTSVIGKWHIHSWPNEVGFDDYLIPRVHHCHSGQAFTHNGGPEFVPDGYSVDYEAAQVEQFLKQRCLDEQPFFLYYNISVPHCPVADAPPRFLEMYNPHDIPLRPNVNPDVPLKDQEYWFKVYRWDFRYYHLGLPHTQTLPPGYDLRTLIAEYYGVTTWMDEAVGRMLSTLDDLGMAENTIVVFASDHGDNLGSHGLVQKGGPTEEAAHIPLLIRWPQQLPSGQIIRSQVAGLVDLAPTLVSLAGGAPLPVWHGVDLSPVLLNPEIALAQNRVFIETAAGVGIRTPRHLYYLPFAGQTRSLGDQPVYFFDLLIDPYQMHNLAGSSVDADTAQKLDGCLREWHYSLPYRDLN